LAAESLKHVWDLDFLSGKFFIAVTIE